MSPAAVSGGGRARATPRRPTRPDDVIAALLGQEWVDVGLFYGQLSLDELNGFLSSCRTRASLETGFDRRIFKKARFHVIASTHLPGYLLSQQLLYAAGADFANVNVAVFINGKPVQDVEAAKRRNHAGLGFRFRTRRSPERLE